MPCRQVVLSFPAVLVTVLLLVGCDQQDAEPFSVEGQVETPQEEPVQGASVGVRPCYDIEDEVACSADALFQQARSSSGPAPVGLVSWRVQQGGSDAVLTWRTASETTNERFEVERKIEGESFTQIATVEGPGTTDEPTNYQYRYENLWTETEYAFRLLAIDADGDVQMLPPVALRVPMLSRIAPLSPNPLRDRTTLRVEAGTTSTVRSTVHTLDGAQVGTVMDATAAQGIHQVQWFS
jgi:hypothetical protein